MSVYEQRVADLLAQIDAQNEEINRLKGKPATSRPRRFCRWCSRRLLNGMAAVRIQDNRGTGSRDGRLRYWVCEDCMATLDTVMDAVPIATVRALIENNRRTLAEAAG